jgi:hypothetical protein
VWDISCEIVDTGLANVEYCTYGCSSEEGGCSHKYCPDGDNDGVANESGCELSPTDIAELNGVNYDRVDYQYVLFENSKNWQNAQDDCVSKGGNLVQIVDSEVKQILDEKFPRATDSSTEYWIGFNDNINEGKFVWPKGNIGEPSTYNWASNKPNDNGDCAVVITDGTWEDRGCLNYRDYVCELPYTFDCDDNNPSVANVCVHTGNASWSNLVSRDMEIERADSMDTVLMISNVTQGDLNYNVKTDKLNFLLFPTTVDLEPKMLNQGSFSPWFVTDTIDNLFFVITDSTSSSWTSNTLVVNNEARNTVPHVEILSPVENSNSSYGGNIQFNATVYDEDDFLKVTWEFGDGNGKTFDNYAQAVNGSSSLSTTHTYTSCGLFDVKLIVEEKGSAEGRENIVEDSHQFFVYREGICVFPVISSPEKRYDYPPLVLFNATQSYVTNCSLGPMGANSFPVGNLNCVYVHEKGKGAINGNYNLFVEWLIDGTKKVSGAWNSDVSGMKIQNFYRWFGEKAYHTAQLKLTFSN